LLEILQLSCGVPRLNPVDTYPARERTLKNNFFALLLAVTSLSLFDTAFSLAQEDGAQQALHEMQEQQRRSDAEFAQQTAQQQKDFQDFVQKGAQVPNSGPTACLPKFSMKSGGVKAGTQIIVSCSTKGAVVYYSSTGWTPTTSSRQYTGPIPILTTTQLQAFATATGMANSPYAMATYTVQGPPLTVFPLEVGSDGLLHAKTRLHLATAASVSSKTAKVGDKIPIVLDQDVKIGDSVAIPKGTPVDATLAAVMSSGTLGRPGSLQFAVHALDIKGTPIPLQGGERLDGTSHITRSVLMWVTVVGSIPAVVMHGGDAVIQPGMKFTVAVAADTSLTLPGARPSATQ